VIEDDEDPVAGDTEEIALRAEAACQGQAGGTEWLKELK